MPQSLTDTINLIASVISIIGGMISVGGAAFKWMARPRATATARQPARQPARRTPSLWSPAAPTPPRQPAAGAIKRSTTHQSAQRDASYPVILGFSALGLLAVVTYSIELLINYAQSGGVSTGIPLNSSLIGVNAVMIVVNLACAVAVTVGMTVTAYRTQSIVWLATGVIALVVSLGAIGVFSVVAFVPGVFYGLSGPRERDIWGA